MAKYQINDIIYNEKWLAIILKCYITNYEQSYTVYWLDNRIIRDYNEDALVESKYKTLK